jgi:ATP-dependent helicase/nuclease subunit A
VWTDPAPAQTFDSNVSISRLLDYRRCARQAFLKSRMPRVEEEVETATNFGRNVHEILAGLRDGEPEEQAMAQRFANSPLGQRSADATWVEREYDFLVECEGVVLRGQMDLVFERDGELVIVDYKTDRHLDAARLDDYSMQMHCYALAVERRWRRPDRCVVFALRESRELTVEADPEAARALVVRWKQEREHAMSPGAHCERCDYYQQECPSPWIADNGSSS